MSNLQHAQVVCCLIRNSLGCILMVRHMSRGWELPQGRVEEGESLLAALDREVHEETGVVITAPRPAAVWSKLSPPTAVIHGFVADYLSGTLTPSLETPEVAWVPEAGSVNRIGHPVSRDRLVDLLAFTGTVRFFSYTTGPYRRLPFVSLETMGQEAG